jgi:hypothetical protein
VLHILCEQFLLCTESSAIRGKALKMADMGKKLDELLSVSDYPVFKKDYLKDKAADHAQAEYAIYLKRLTREDRQATAWTVAPEERRP